jgi:capsid protein
LFLESDAVMAIYRKYVKWVVGSGLKLQAEPQSDVLLVDNITVDSETFNKKIEARWKIYANSKMADWCGMETLNALANTCYLSSIVGGDTLVVLRFENNTIKVQLIDGAHLGGSLGTPAGKNRIVNGVELNERGQHVAFHVKGKGLAKPDRIAARDSNGFMRAFLVYGLDYRIDNVRGMPLIAAVMETAKKLDRYKEATVGNAEERQKIPYFFEHTQHSDGSNPLEALTASVTGSPSNAGVSNGVAVTRQAEVLTKTVAATTNKQTFNMPIGATVKSLESKNELYFAEFFSVNIGLICATLGIPPEIAMSKYDSNYSASRAAIKDWEHTLNVERKSFADQFYQPIYNFWLYTQLIQNKIEAPGYLRALTDKNEMVLEAYHYARFIGANVPHIDPLKEVAAERAKLGSAGAHIPLTTAEAATEALNGGDAASNMKQYASEIQLANELEIPTAAQDAQQQNNDNNNA